MTKDLIGKTVSKLYVSYGEEFIVFENTDGTKLVYVTYGDCCSETWIADILGVGALLGGKVIAVDNLEVPAVNDGRGRQEEDQFYGVKITTNKGYCDIIYRNSSNGYYGGSIEICDEMPQAELRQITDDWSFQ